MKTWQIALPYHIPQLVKSYSFIYPRRPKTASISGGTSLYRPLCRECPPPPRGVKKHKFCRASGKDCFCSQLAYCQCLSVGAHPKGLCNLKTLTRWLEHYIRLSLKILFFQRIHFSFLTTYPLSKRVNQNKFSTHPETLAWASETTWIENATRCKPTW